MTHMCIISEGVTNEEVLTQLQSELKKAEGVIFATSETLAYKRNLLQGIRIVETVIDYNRMEKELADLRKAAAGLLSDWEDQFGEGQCDCRPEPENDGHVCNSCRVHALVNN